MFIVGVALPFSVANRIKRGQSPMEIRNHVLVRSLLLLLLGWGLYCIGPGHIVFRFQNVLAQLAVTYLLAYLVMEWPGAGSNSVFHDVDSHHRSSVSNLCRRGI